MTRRNDELRRRSYENLLHAAGDAMLPAAIEALGEYQKLREAGKKPEIWYSPHHGWVIKDGGLA